MISRCLFITSSYSRRCLRISKLRVSTRFWAVPMARVTSLCSMGSPSSMPTRAPPQLVVDPARLVPLRPDDVQSPERHHALVLGVRHLLGFRPRGLPGPGGSRGGVEPLLPQDLLGEEVRVAPQQDVGAAAGHVGGDGDGPFAPGLRHDLRLPLVVLGVQYLMRDPPLLEQPGEVLRGLY